MTWRPLLPGAVLVLLGLVGTGVCVLGWWRAQPHRGAAVRVGWAARLVMVWALVVVAAQPSSSTQDPVGTPSANVDVLVVVDRTGSMAAQDWDGGKPRLDGVRADLTTLVDALPGARWSVLAWDSQAVQTLPFTTDAHAVTSWAATVRQEISDYSSGSQIDRPLDKMTQILRDDAKRRPSAHRYVVMMSDGEPTADTPITSFATVSKDLYGGVVLGYGTTGGGRMRSYDGSVDPDPNAPWILDQSGQPAVSRIDESVLTTVAGQMHVPYLHRTSPAPGDLTAWAKKIDVEPMTVPGRSSTVFLAQTWPAAFVLGLALAVETALTVPRRRSR